MQQKIACIVISISHCGLDILKYCLYMCMIITTLQQKSLTCQPTVFLHCAELTDRLFSKIRFLKQNLFETWLRINPPLIIEFIGITPMNIQLHLYSTGEHISAIIIYCGVINKHMHSVPFDLYRRMCPRTYCTKCVCSCQQWDVISLPKISWDKKRFSLHNVWAALGVQCIQ